MRSVPRVHTLFNNMIIKRRIENIIVPRVQDSGNKYGFMPAFQITLFCGADQSR